MSAEHAVPTSAPGLVVHRAGDVRVEPVPVAAPGPDEALVEIAYGGVCGSDLHYWQHGAAGLSVLAEPMLLGHEVVGVVRRAATDGSGPAAGTPVAVHPARPSAGDGSVRTDADPARVGAVALTAGIPLTELRSAEGAGLEDMFLSLTADTQREGAAA